METPTPIVAMPDKEAIIARTSSPSGSPIPMGLVSVQAIVAQPWLATSTPNAAVTAPRT